MFIAGITDQGLYRIVGVGSKVQNLLLQCIDKKKAKTVDLADEECEWEVKTITSALKQYLRSVYNLQGSLNNDTVLLLLDPPVVV